jgi:hypothetical protein
LKEDKNGVFTCVSCGRNATEAMDLADSWLGVPKLLTPEEIVNPNVDEMSMMTYLSQFPNAKASMMISMTRLQIRTMTATMMCMSMTTTTALSRVTMTMMT